MKIHYFQRYHKGEDVATANTMLLLHRLYSYSSKLFFQILKEQFFSDEEFEPEISFVLQEKGIKSIPDATITQPSFKLIVETKLTDWFYQEQLIKHISSFKNEAYKVLITLSSELMNQKKKDDVDNKIKNYNIKNNTDIKHVNTTFEMLAQGIQDVLTDRDYEMQDILDDYLEYCRNDKLINNSEAWKKLRMQLAGTTFEFNVNENVYYDKVERGFSAHEYLGLYKQKSIRAIGKISAIITAISQDGELVYDVEKGELTDERKMLIDKARKDAGNYGYVLNAHRYFFVDKFYKTDFPKITKRPPMGTKMFDLTEILNLQELPSTEEIAKLLKEKNWT